MRPNPGFFILTFFLIFLSLFIPFIDFNFRLRAAEPLPIAPRAPVPPAPMGPIPYLGETKKPAFKPIDLELLIPGKILMVKKGEPPDKCLHPGQGPLPGISGLENLTDYTTCPKGNVLRTQLARPIIQMWFDDLEQYTEAAAWALTHIDTAGGKEKGQEAYKKFQCRSSDIWDRISSNPQLSRKCSLVNKSRLMAEINDNFLKNIKTHFSHTTGQLDSYIETIFQKFDWDGNIAKHMRMDTSGKMVFFSDEEKDKGLSSLELGLGTPDELAMPCSDQPTPPGVSPGKDCKVMLGDSVDEYQKHMLEQLQVAIHSYIEMLKKQPEAERKSLSSKIPDTQLVNNKDFMEKFREHLATLPDFQGEGSKERSEQFLKNLGASLTKHPIFNMERTKWKKSKRSLKKMGYDKDFSFNEENPESVQEDFLAGYLFRAARQIIRRGTTDPEGIKSYFEGKFETLSGGVLARKCDELTQSFAQMCQFITYNQKAPLNDKGIPVNPELDFQFKTHSGQICPIPKAMVATNGPFYSLMKKYLLPTEDSLSDKAELDADKALKDDHTQDILRKHLHLDDPKVQEELTRPDDEDNEENKKLKKKCSEERKENRPQSLECRERDMAKAGFISSGRIRQRLMRQSGLPQNWNAQDSLAGKVNNDPPHKDKETTPQPPNQPSHSSGTQFLGNNSAPVNQDQSSRSHNSSGGGSGTTPTGPTSLGPEVPESRGHTPTVAVTPPRNYFEEHSYNPSTSEGLSSGSGNQAAKALPSETDSDKKRSGETGEKGTKKQIQELQDEVTRLNNKVNQQDPPKKGTPPKESGPSAQGPVASSPPSGKGTGGSSGSAKEKGNGGRSAGGGGLSGGSSLSSSDDGGTRSTASQGQRDQGGKKGNSPTKVLDPLDNLLGSMMNDCLKQKSKSPSKAGLEDCLPLVENKDIPEKEFDALLTFLQEQKLNLNRPDSRKQILQAIEKKLEEIMVAGGPGGGEEGEAGNKKKEEEKKKFLKKIKPNIQRIGQSLFIKLITQEETRPTYRAQDLMDNVDKFKN